VLPPVNKAAGLALPPQAALPLGAAMQENSDTKPSPLSSDPITSGELKKFSYGDSNLSVLFLPNQIDRMKQSIRTFETSSKDAKPTTFIAPTPVVEAPVEKIIEPADYPVFYLSSIAFDGPNDWAIWMGGQKITSRRNDTDVTVLRVSPDSATFSWQPTYKEAIERRRAADLFAATDEVKNKLASVQSASQDENGSVIFTLRQNQAFAVGYFKTFEGFVKSPKLDPISVAGSENSMSTMITDAVGSLMPSRAPVKPGQPQPMGVMDRLKAGSPTGVSPVTGTRSMAVSGPAAASPNNLPIPPEF
jgi:hypothetical protein